eukprot:CAMPEP_0172062366 /NCGR_PEP_ID=MMETSP1043-20130122/8993_1 /TAXON_ID=464988 /ORGANISM="Hemiselmis andersenii, Strain CCMP441" /LENGTH=208 /DNA_ID=CAMNT_0012722261 /DNA_START=43 /DNA_END=665 /DNA_ORIENTATION=-
MAGIERVFTSVRFAAEYIAPAGGAFDAPGRRMFAVSPGKIVCYMVFCGIASLAMFIFSMVYYTVIHPKNTSEILDCRAPSCELMYFDKTGLTYKTAGTSGTHMSEYGLGVCVYVVSKMVKEWNFPNIIGLPSNPKPGGNETFISLTSAGIWGRRGGVHSPDTVPELEGTPKFSMFMSKAKKEAAERKRAERNDIIKRMMAHEELHGGR